MKQNIAFGSWMKQRRMALHLSPADLAHLVHCSSATIRKIEGGSRRPSQELAALLARHLNIPRHEHTAWIAFARGAQNRAETQRYDSTGTPHVPFGTLPPRQQPATLPPPVRPCIGREQETTLLRHWLVRDGTRLITLRGPGGVGKTRLGLEVAASVTDAFADGVVFVGLESLTEPSGVAQAILQSLPVVDPELGLAHTCLLEYCCDKQMLLVLDNFEHLLAATPLLTDMLLACPWLHILATSRVALQLRSERLYTVTPLSLPERCADVPFERLSEYSAIALFLQCVQAVRHDWRLSPTEAAAVVDLCQSLDGLPLAIEIAAAQGRLLSPSSIRHQLLCHTSRLLHTCGFRDAPRRHYSLHDAIAWSYHLLDPAAQQLVARLAIFHGGWTMDAMVAVCAEEALPMDVHAATSPPVLLDSLLMLVEHHLVRQDVMEDGRPRFSMLQTIRQYACELLEAQNEMEMMQERHANYFRDLAEYAEPLLCGRGQREGLWHLEPERANIQAALAWYHTARTGAMGGLRLAGALGEFWFIRSNVVEGYAWLETFLNAAVDLPLSIRAKALRYAAVLASAQGRVTDALRWNQASLDVYARIGDRWGTAYTLAALGDVQVTHHHDSAHGHALLAESLRMAREVNDTWLLGRVTWRVGLHMYYSGSDVEHGRALLAESLALATSVQDLWGMSNVLPQVANSVWLQGDESHAVTLLEEALTLAWMIGNQRSIATTLNILGGIALAQHNHLRARSYHEESLRVAQTACLPFPHAGAIYFLGRVALYQDLYTEAKTRLLQSIQHYHTLHAMSHIVEPLMLLAMVHLKTAQMEDATRLLGMVTHLLRELDRNVPAIHQPDYEQMLSSTQSALEPCAWRREWELGQHMSVEQLLMKTSHDSRPLERFETRAYDINLSVPRKEDSQSSARSPVDGIRSIPC